MTAQAAPTPTPVQAAPAKPAPEKPAPATWTHEDEKTMKALEAKSTAYFQRRFTELQALVEEHLLTMEHSSIALMLMSHPTEFINAIEAWTEMTPEKK